MRGQGEGVGSAMGGSAICGVFYPPRVVYLSCASHLGNQNHRKLSVFDRKLEAMRIV